MSAIARRQLLQGLTGSVPLAISGVAQGSSEGPREAPLGPHGELLAPDDAIAMLFDTTLCIGCQACVVACAETNGLSPDTRLSGGVWQMPIDLNSHTKNIVKLAKDDQGNSSFVKRQCMHCLDPACVAGCPFGALSKVDRGIVTWTASACIGCRFCEVACPFEVPKFEWDMFNPKIVKCEFCREQRLDKGSDPACTSVCPTAAVVFGTRKGLLQRAHDRLQAKPGVYAEGRVYGEIDAGGTQVLYLSHLPFATIGLPQLSALARPGRELRFQALLYRWLLLPVVLYGLITAIIRKRWRAHDQEVTELEAKRGLKEQL